MAHISLVTLGVENLERATDFYTALGWRRSSASVDGVVAFFSGVPVLALFGREDLAADARLPAAARPTPGGAALAMNVPDPAEVDRVAGLAEAAGATVTKAPGPTDWGGYAACFLDPDGHLWEVAHNPGFGLAPDGSLTLPG